MKKTALFLTHFKRDHISAYLELAFCLENHIVRSIDIMVCRRELRESILAHSRQSKARLPSKMAHKTSPVTYC